MVLSPRSAWDLHISALHTVLPPAIDAEEVVEFSLVITTPARAIYLLESRWRGEGDLAGRNADHGPVLLVKAVDVHGPISVEFVPLEHQRCQVGHGRAGDFGEGRGEADKEADGEEESGCRCEDGGGEE